MTTFHKQAAQLTHEYLEKAVDLFPRFIMPSIEILFNLRGGSAGQIQYMRISRGEYKVRYNKVLLAENGEDFLARTVPHEVAHIVAREVHGDGIRSHGPEWKRIMAKLVGCKISEISRCHSYVTANVGNRRQAYCGCDTKHVSTVIYNKMRRGASYRCGDCKCTITLEPSDTVHTIALPTPATDALLRTMKAPGFRAGSKKQQVFEYYLKTNAPRELVMAYCKKIGLKESTGSGWYSSFKKKANR